MMQFYFPFFLLHYSTCVHTPATAHSKNKRRNTLSHLVLCLVMQMVLSLSAAVSEELSGFSHNTDTMEQLNAFK